MDSYWSVKYLLDLNNGNLPVHKGMRQKRYKSIEKMLDLFDILKRIGPKKPMEVISLDPSDRKVLLNYLKFKLLIKQLNGKMT